MLSISSVITAILLLLPLPFFSASPNKPTSTLPPNSLIALLSALTLILRIPFLLVTTPKFSIPTSVRRSTTTDFQNRVGKLLIWAFVCVLALCTTLGSQGKTVGKVINDMGLVGALLGTYLLPAIMHIITHHFKRPLSIIIPNTPLATTSPPSASRDASSPHSPPLRPPNTQSPYDELLQRKERALQRRRLGRRIMWDIGVWVLLVPVGGGGIAWGVGRVIEK